MHLRVVLQPVSALGSCSGDVSDQGSRGSPGGSGDTLRRWADAGRIETITDSSGRLAVDGVALARFGREMAESADHWEGRAVIGHSVRNRFSGLVSRVACDTVMAQVEIQAGPTGLCHC
jgi:hypothetical protein